MKTMMAVAALLAAGLVGVEAQDQPPMPKPTKEHEWLRLLDGEWTTEGECQAEPGKTMKMKGSASGRSIGGFWNVLENRGEFMGAPFSGIMTLGYDPEKKKFVGTWVDSMTSILWKYEGSVDAAGKVLTLHAEGPCPKTGKMTKFEEKIEITNKDLWSFSSAAEVDGKMTPYVKVVYTRKVS